MIEITDKLYFIKFKSFAMQKTKSKRVRGQGTDLKLNKEIKQPNFKNGVLLWWSSGKESACQSRGQRFDAWSKKIPHVMEEQTLCTTTTEPAFWSPPTTTTEA